MSKLAVTMKTVASRAGVSMMTVSRVLRNHRSVADETRRAVMRAVEETGYRPNPLVGAWMAHMRSSMAQQREQETIAFLTADQDPDGAGKSLTIRSYLEGAFARAEQLGFKIERFWLGEKGMTGARMSDILEARGIAGVLIAPLPLPVQTIDLRWERFAAVGFGYSMREPTLHRVTNHQIHSMRMALEEVGRLGYRRIGLALEHSKDARVDFNWTTGFLPYQMRVSAKDRVKPFLPHHVSPDGLLAWVRKERPEVILGGRQDMIEWLRDAGMRVPEDIGFVSLEYYPEFGDLAGVDQKSLIVGAAAVELVVEQLYHNERGVPPTPKVVLIEGRWRAGASVRQLPPREDSGMRKTRKPRQSKAVETTIR
jgi:LacI family transcriptional regulator